MEGSHFETLSHVEETWDASFEEVNKGRSIIPGLSLVYIMSWLEGEVDKEGVDSDGTCAWEELSTSVEETHWDKEGMGK